MEEKIRVAILGADRVVSAELIRLLMLHPKTEIVLLTSEKYPGYQISEVFPHLTCHVWLGYQLPDLICLSEVEWPALDADVIFNAMPQKIGQQVLKGLGHAVQHNLMEEIIAEGPDDLAAQAPENIKIIDLSGDFRIKDVETYEKLHGQSHEAKNLLNITQYGLMDWHDAPQLKSQMIACPSCYSTASLLALLPLMEAGFVDDAPILISAMDSVSISPNQQDTEGHFRQNFMTQVYLTEILQEVSKHTNKQWAASFTINPRVSGRGLLLTINVPLKQEYTCREIRSTWSAVYETKPFVQILPKGTTADVRMICGSNFCVMSCELDQLENRAILSVALDPYIKGASGQAIQAMNKIFNLDETTGLKNMVIYP